MAVLIEAKASISLAHLYHYNFTRTKRRRLVQDFVNAGGHDRSGQWYRQPAEQVGTLSILAREFKLKVTAGSDFHQPQQWSELGIEPYLTILRLYSGIRPITHCKDMMMKFFQIHAVNPRERLVKTSRGKSGFAKEALSFIPPTHPMH